MPRTTVLAAAATTGTSDDIVVADGQSRTVALFSTGALAGDMELQLMLRTPGLDRQVALLTASNSAVVLTGPGTFRVVRPAVSAPVGVFTES